MKGVAPTRLEIERVGGRVTVRIDFGDEYAAMEIYDRLISQTKSGRLRLAVDVSGPVEETAR